MQDVHEHWSVHPGDPDEPIEKSREDRMSCSVWVLVLPWLRVLAWLILLCVIASTATAAVWIHIIS